MHDYFGTKPFIYILFGLLLSGIIGCIFCLCCLPVWRERRKNKIQIVPMKEYPVMVNPMRIKTEKILRLI